MSRHSFEPEIAKLVGVNAAVIYQNIVFWCEKNAANSRNIFEGNAWTYNSIKAFSSLFPYLSERQIRTSLDKLEEHGLILVDCFNKEARDRTKWYAVHDKTVLLHLSEMSEPFVRNVRALPDSKPDNKQDTPNPKGNDLFSENSEPLPEQSTFDDFYKVYPKKAGKPAAKKAWDAAVKKADPSLIIEGAKRYAHWLANPKKGEFRPHVKHPQGWLNAERWADEEIWQGAGDLSKPNFDALSDSQRNMIENGICPPSMKNPDGTPSDTAKAMLEIVRQNVERMKR